MLILNTLGQVTASPTVVTVLKAAPAPKTMGGVLPLGGPLAKRDDAIQFDPFQGNSDGEGFVVSEKEYYLMRVCEGIAAIAILGMLIKTCMVIWKCCNQKEYAYAKVDYNTDVTTDENL